MIVFAHDYETTGVDAKTCGVVQAALCFAKLFDDGSYEILSQDVQLLHPGEPIPAGSSNVHGIYDHHVEDAAPYDVYLTEQFMVVNDTAIEAVAGFNSKRYDDVIARRCGMAEFPSLDLYIAANRFKTLGILQKANLSASYLGLTGREAQNAHDAFADIVMTLDLLAPSMEKAGCSSVAEFKQWVNSPWGHPQMTMPFGKHKGKKLCNLPKDYIAWALENMTSLTPDLRKGMEMVR